MACAKRDLEKILQEKCSKVDIEHVLYVRRSHTHTAAAEQSSFVAPNREQRQPENISALFEPYPIGLMRIKR